MIVMSTKSKVFRVMIGSPSDLAEERQAATDAVNEWNAQHAEAEGAVLLPVKWETHALPTSGVRPQLAINDQIGDHCDFLIGMFWTKLGTPTGVAASGTVEEIDRFVAAGKPAMLYFSRKRAPKGKTDAVQMAKLKKFKRATYKNSLMGSFDDASDLKKSFCATLAVKCESFIESRYAPGRSTVLVKSRTSSPNIRDAVLPSKNSKVMTNCSG